MAQRDTLADLLYGLSRDVSEVWKDVLRENDLAPAPLLILREAHHEPGLTVTELARRTQTAKSHVSRSVDALARRGFLEKRPDPSDQRVVRIYPVLNGETGLDPLRAEILRKLVERMESLTSDQVEEISSALRALRTVFRQSQ